jgi:hypothetical protein
MPNDLPAATSPLALDQPNDDVIPHPRIPRFPAEEEASMLASSRALRASANSLFAISDYDGAVAGYERALAALPSYREYEAAVVRANMAACFVKTAEWKGVVREADQGLDALEEWEKEDSDAVEEVEPGESECGEEPKVEDVRRIRSKLLLRRAKANAEIGGWAALQRALDGEYAVVTMFSTQ